MKSEEARFHPAAALPLSWYERPAPVVARELLGAILVSVIEDCLVAGVIVEVEAYAGPEDPASHAARFRQGPARSMWGPSGHTYVYRAYGVYPCLNVVTDPDGVPGAVLLRAAFPLAGVGIMRERRQRKRRSGNRRFVPLEHLARGPGALAQAFGISTEHHGLPLDRPPVWIQPGRSEFAIICGPRVGIRSGRELHWRFAVANHPAVSRPRLEQMGMSKRPLHSISSRLRRAG